VESAGHARAPLLGHDVQSTELAEGLVDRDRGVADDPAFSFGDPEPHPRSNRCDPLPIACNAILERCKLTQFLVDDVRHARVPGGFVGTHELLRVVCGGAGRIRSLGAIRSRLRGKREEAPRLRDAFQLVLAPWLEA
jgi:hypothetical protein